MSRLVRRNWHSIQVGQGDKDTVCLGGVRGGWHNVQVE
jgi:hypothetical protein